MTPLTQTTPMPSAPTATDDVVRVRHLSKMYGRRTVVDDLTFRIPRGDVVGLIGPNGAGKTTTMKMLLGLVAATGGDVELFGVPIGAPGWGEGLRRVGSMIEAPPIYDRMSADANLRYQSLAVTGRIDHDEIDRLLALVDLADRSSERPKGYSLGMRQRLGIAIAMIGRPELVILDEPANGLDPAGIRDIRTLLTRLPEEGSTVLVSSHQLAELQQVCDRLIVLSEGHVVVDDGTEEILARTATQRLHLTVAPADLADAIGRLRAAGLSPVDASGSVTSGSVITVDPPPGVHGDTVNRTLAEGGIYASAIERPSVSLEDAFLELIDQEVNR